MSAQPGQATTVAEREPRSVPAPAAAPLTPLARRLLQLLRRDASADEPITQLDAGIALVGATSGKETIRRHVQHMRDELTAAGYIVCADGRGMWLAETEKQIDEYYVWLLSKSHSTLRTAARIKRVSLRRLIRDLYETLREQGDDPAAPLPPQEKRVSRVERELAPDSPKCSYCDKPFAGPRGREHLTLYCSARCRYRAANERRAAS